MKIYRWILEMCGIGALGRFAYLVAAKVWDWNDMNSQGFCVVAIVVLTGAAIAEEMQALIEAK